MKRATLSSSILASGLLVLTAGYPASAAPPKLPDSGPIVLRLEEAVEIAMVYSYSLREARLEADDIREQVRQAWSPVWPQIDGSASYTRNITAPNPFAGSGAGNAFGAFDPVGWLAFNEQARLDGNDTISLMEFQDRSEQALANAGVIVDPDANPFLVENQFNFNLTVRQVLYDGAVFSGLRGTSVAHDLADAGVDVEMLNTIRDVASAFYGALLSEQQTTILEKSVARAQATVDETEKRVEQGVVPQFELLTAEVELANLQTEFARAKNAANRSLNDLRLLIGLPADRPLKLRGELSFDGAELDVPTTEEAVGVALESRPDVKEAALTVRSLEIQESATWGRYLPRLEAIANLSYLGSIPDDRTITLSTDNPDDPFELRAETTDFFSDSFWFSSISVGVQLEWEIFEGLQVTSQLERDRLATQRSRIQLERLRSLVRIEVQQSLLDLSTARQQIATQERNRERAELNYSHAQTRVREGVSNQFELRQASEQLDESRFNYLQAVHDFLVARVAYLVAIGTPPVLGSNAQ